MDARGRISLKASVFVYWYLESDLKPEIFHTYIYFRRLLKTCDIPYVISSDECGECAINLSC